MSLISPIKVASPPVTLRMMQRIECEFISIRLLIKGDEILNI